jgi:GAF domain-containing protein
LTVPIFNGDDLLGALDVQAAHDQPFTANQIEAFRSLGQRLGAALAHARLITDLRQAVREREEAAAYMRAQLTQMQGSSRRLLQSGWNQYLQSRGAVFGYDLQNSGGSIVPAADVPQDILPALTRGDVVAEMRGDEQVISAPIISRGEMLGAMTFAVPADRAIGDDEIETVRTIANRLGLALENNRLLEQTQAQALRERKATEVANILLTATSIESLMELAAENFNEALNAINTRIYLEPGAMTEPPAAHGEPA